MNRWLVEYKAAAYRTRWIGLTGAALTLGAVACELIRLHTVVSWSEAPFQGDFADMVMARVSLLGLVGIAFIVRAFFLLVFKPERYSWVTVSWFFCFATAIFYLLEMSPGYSPTATCEEDGRCFTIYHNSNADWVSLACIGFVTFSFFRALVIAAMAGSRYRLK